MLSPSTLRGAHDTCQRELCVVCGVVCLDAANDVQNNHDEVWVERKRGRVRASTLRSRAHVVSTPPNRKVDDSFTR